MEKWDDGCLEDFIWDQRWHALEARPVPQPSKNLVFAPRNEFVTFYVKPQVAMRSRDGTSSRLSTEI